LRADQLMISVVGPAASLGVEVTARLIRLSAEWPHSEVWDGA